MPLSTNTRSYQHVAVVLDAAIAAGGGRYRLESNKAAVRWRQLAYQYRKLLEKEARAKIGILNYPVSTAYDMIYLTLEDNVVIIGTRAPDGQLELFDGSAVHFEKPTLEKVQPTSTTSAEDDDLLRQAAGFGKKEELL